MALEQIQPKIELARITAYEALGVVTELVPDVFIGRSFLVNTNTPLGTLELTATFHSDGGVEYKRGKKSLYISADGSVDHKHSTLTLTEDIDLTTVTWTAHPVSRSEKDRNSEEISDEVTATMLNYFYRELAHHAQNPKNFGQNKEDLLLRYEGNCLLGKVEGHHLVPITKFLRNLLEMPYAYAAMLTNYDAEFPNMQTSGQMVFLSKKGQYIIDLDFPDDKHGIYDTITAKGSLERLAEASLKQTVFLDRDGDVFVRSTAHDDQLGQFFLLRKKGESDLLGGAIGRTVEDLEQIGFQGVGPKLTAAQFKIIREILRQWERIEGTRELAHTLFKEGLIPTDTPDQAFGKIKTLTQIGPMLDKDGNVIVAGKPGYVQIPGVHSESLTTPTGGPKGLQKSQLGVWVGDQLIVLGMTGDTDEHTLARLDPGQELSLQHFINFQLALDNDNLVEVKQPVLGVVMLMRDPEKGISRTYLACMYPHLGAETIFGMSALMSAPRTDVFLTVSSGNMFYQNALDTTDQKSTTLVRNEAEASILTAVTTRGAFLTPQEFGIITQKEFNIILKKLKFHDAGSHGAFGMTQADFEDLQRRFSITMEIGQMRLGIQWLTQALAQTEAMVDSTVNVSELRKSFQKRLKIFAKNGQPAIALPEATPEQGLALAKVEQRTSIEQFATTINDFSVDIASRNTTFWDLKFSVDADGNLTVVMRPPESNNYVLPSNPIITLQNISQVLTSAEKTASADQIMHTAIVENDSQINVNGRPYVFNAGDVIFSHINFTDNVIDSEQIVRRRQNEQGQMEYFDVSAGTERILSSNNLGDIELELMYRYLHGEIDFTSQDKENFIAQNIAAEIYMPHQLTVETLMETYKKVQSAAEHEYVLRQMSAAADVIADHFNIPQENLANRLYQEYRRLHTEDLTETALMDGCIAVFDIDREGKMKLDINFTDIIGHPSPQIARKIIIDLNQKSLVFQREAVTGKGNKQQTTRHDEHDLLLYDLVKKLFADSSLFLTFEEIAEVYAEYNNEDDNIWIHNQAGTQIAVRRNNVVTIYDRTNPNFIEIIENADENYVFGEEGDAQEASIVERRFFVTEILKPPTELSMLAFYGGDIEAKLQLMDKLTEKEVKMTARLEQTRAESDLTKLHLFPESDLLTDPERLFNLGIMAIIASLDEDTDTAKMIETGEILDYPAELSSGNCIVDTKIRVKRGYTATSTVKLVALARDPTTNQRYIIIGPHDGESLSFHGISTRDPVPYGRAYTMMKNGNNHYELSTIDLAYEFSEKGRYLPTRQRQNVSDFMGREGKRQHQTYRGELRKILENDAIGAFILSVERERDWEKAIILGEMMGMNTKRMNKGTMPQIIAYLHSIYMEPFPELGKLTPRINPVAELIPVVR
ncbi:hypothetical protein C4579_00710 [Candidatus Microgenomates bacterium]|nr:MAG: hypothetical protein C4579_00710 [Candidatus Microgenomates bacterium]